MTTSEIRQEALDCMNGSQPMSFADAVKAVRGYREELGLVGSIQVRVSHWDYASGRESLEWEACFSSDAFVAAFRAPTAERMLAGFRLELLKLTDPQPVDLASVGVSVLTSEQGA